MTVTYASIFDTDSFDSNTIFTGNTQYAKQQLLVLGRKWLSESNKFFIGLKEIKKQFTLHFEEKLQLNRADSIFKALKKLGDVVLHNLDTAEKTIYKRPELILPFLKSELDFIKQPFSAVFDLMEWVTIIPNEWVHEVQFSVLRPIKPLLTRKLNLIKHYIGETEYNRRMVEEAEYANEMFDKNERENCNEAIFLNGQDPTYFGGNNGIDAIRRGYYHGIVVSEAIPLLRKYDFTVHMHKYLYSLDKRELFYKYDILNSKGEELGHIAPIVIYDELGRKQLQWRYANSNLREFLCRDLEMVEAFLIRTLDKKYNPDTDYRFYKQLVKDTEEQKGF